MTPTKRTAKTRKTVQQVGPVPSEARRGECSESAGGGHPAPAATVVGTHEGPVHFLDGLRCTWCTALNASWLWADGSTVECAECGQTSFVVADMGEGA